MFGKTKNDNIFIIIKNYISVICQKTKEERIQEKIKEDNLETTKKEQLKLFKFFFTFFFIIFVAVLFISFYFNLFLWVLLAETVITLISFILYKNPPKKVKYNSVFLMPVVAFGCTIFFNTILLLIFSFNVTR